MATLDVVFLAPGRLGWIEETRRRSIPFAPGEPVPRIGECVVLAFEAGACRWTVEDVAHVFGDVGHEIAVRLALITDASRTALPEEHGAMAIPPRRDRASRGFVDGALTRSLQGVPANADLQVNRMSFPRLATPANRIAVRAGRGGCMISR